MKAEPAEPQSSWMHWNPQTPTEKRGVTLLARMGWEGSGGIELQPISTTPRQGFPSVAGVCVCYLTFFLQHRVAERPQEV